MLKIGININNNCGKDDIEALENVVRAGFKNIMLSFTTNCSKEFMRTVQNLGVSIEYFHINNIYSNALWARGEETETAIKEIIKQIEFCGKHNIPIAIMHVTNGSPTDLALSPTEQGLKNFRTIFSAARKNRVKIALENMDYYGLKNFYYLLDNVKDKNVGFCYDLGHHHLYNPQTNLIKKYGSRLFAVHLHDNLMDWFPGYDCTRDLHRLPFDGNIDFNKVCKNLKSSKYKGVVMLEVRKKSFGKPQLYSKTSNMRFLKTAHERAEQIKDMIS